MSSMVYEAGAAIDPMAEIVPLVPLPNR